MSTPNTDTSTSAEDNMNETIQITIPDQKTTPIPLFLKKLWKMVNDINAEEIIGWNTSGDGFIIYDQVKFVTELLPTYFKHNNLSSFIRQLNFYDFHKVANVDKHEMEFAHPCFLKDLPETLAFITRKVPNVKYKTTQGLKQENINEVLTGVKELRSNHTLIDNELKMLKKENAALWSEISSLRIKYSNQTKVINKLIHFLISYMHTHQNTFGKTNITTVSRKLDQKHLKNTPQLFQIDYCKSPSSDSEKTSPMKIPGPSKIINPNTVKNSNQKYIKPKLLSNKATILKAPISVTAKKYPLPTVSSYKIETNPEIYPEVYNVTSPGLQESVFPKSPYPIEEIVTEVDPMIEETSVYTVKFPKRDESSSRQNQSLLAPITDLNSLNVVTNQAPQSQQESPSKVLSTNEAKLTSGKRKLSGNNLTSLPIQKPKITNTSQKEKTLKLIIPKSTQSAEGNKRKSFKLMPKSKKKAHNVIENNFDKGSQIPQPSPVKPEVVLENLFSEIEKPGTSQNVSSILSTLSPNSGNFGIQFETDDVEQHIVPNQDDSAGVANSPSEILSSLSVPSVDPEGSISGDPSEEILPSFSTDQEELPSEIHPILKSELMNDIETELENYPDRMLSSFSVIPEVHSPSRELMKYNIIENPKENLGMYLDNTQIQLNNIQDLLNDLNSEELFDLLGCFNNVDEEQGNSEQRGNQILSAHELEN